jgi:hypothetical protein
MNADERRLWRVGPLSCVMVSCCAGAELQLRKDRPEGGPVDFEITLRELYPTKSDLYERARELEAECRRAAPTGS